jgi:hypothetical protein
MAASSSELSCSAGRFDGGACLRAAGAGRFEAAGFFAAGFAAGFGGGFAGAAFGAALAGAAFAGAAFAGADFFAGAGFVAAFYFFAGEVGTARASSSATPSLPPPCSLPPCSLPLIPSSLSSVVPVPLARLPPSRLSTSRVIALLSCFGAGPCRVSYLDTMLSSTGRRSRSRLRQQCSGGDSRSRGRWPRQQLAVVWHAGVGGAGRGGGLCRTQRYERRAAGNDERPAAQAALTWRRCLPVRERRASVQIAGWAEGRHAGLLPEWRELRAHGGERRWLRLRGSPAPRPKQRDQTVVDPVVVGVGNPARPGHGGSTAPPIPVSSCRRCSTVSHACDPPSLRIRAFASVPEPRGILG